MYTCCRLGLTALSWLLLPAAMDYGETRAMVDGESVTTLVVFGEDDAPALLGAYTLEGLALAVDPVEQRLVPTHLIMY